MTIADKVLEKLQDKGPMRMKELGAAVDCSFIAQVVRKLLAVDKVKTSAEKRNAYVALPGQRLPEGVQASAPTRERKKRKGKATKKAGPRIQRAKVLGGGDFLPGIASDYGMVIVGHGPTPLRFTPQQTERIAELCLQQFAS